MNAREDRLTDALAGALLWVASFCFAAALFLPSYKLLRLIPPPDPVAVGVVTIQEVSKRSEYAFAALFYILVPLLTIALRPGLERLHGWIAGAVEDPSERLASAALFAVPLVAAPFLFVATNKEGWGVLLPLALAGAGPGFLRAVRTRAWLRGLLAPDLRPFHALVLLEAASWIVFRYLATGSRIAHIPTLLLELPFVALFAALFWIIVAGLARAASLARGGAAEGTFARIAVGASPLVLLPVIPLTRLAPAPAATVVVAAAIAGVVAGALGARPERPGERAGRAVRHAVAVAGIPLLLFVIGWSSNANLTAWLDLFHRGESLGPASDYLADDVPYRDTFVLHGMLEDGFLDAMLMEWLGRDAGVAAARVVTMSVLSIVALWFLALAAFDSIPLALAVVALGSTTFVENPRALVELVVAALLLAALWRRSAILLAAAGASTALALFYSLDIGVYACAGSIVTIAVWTAWSRRTGLARALAGSLGAWLAGLVAGAAPFALWLASHGALGAFLQTSFIDVPRTIDAVWSLPFPDLPAAMRGDMSLRSIADLVLGPTARFLLNPLVLAVAAVVVLVRLRSRREPGRIDLALLLLTAFGVITQRSALGRADFQHQYFSAFLVAPLLVAFFVVAARATRRVWREREPRARVILAGAALAAVPLLGSLLWIPDLLSTRLDSVIAYRARTAGASPDAVGATLRDRIEHVVAEIRRWSPPGGAMFDFSNQPAFYFFADRRNPTRFFQIPIASPAEWQLEIIRDLEQSRPPVVVRDSPEGYDRFDGIPNEVRAQAIAAYLGDRYEHRRTIRGVEIWTRRRGARDPEPEAYLRAIHLPGEIPAPRERRVVPLGSAAGAAGAFWVSDLLVQNPHAEPVELFLRYASNRGTRDRTLSIAPGELRIVRDASRSLFGMPASIGVLWIEHAVDRAPLVAAETRDRARGGVPSRALPFSLGDAATAREEKGALTLIAPAGGGARRINVGVINFGLVPAHVRIQARRPDGSPAGALVQVAIEEEKAWQLVDAEGQLGVAFDEPLAIRIDVLEGTVVGWASVVDGASGIHEFVRAFPTTR
ncbi:MAG: hypothetical protein ACRD2J_17905 [Thermoanaerobaculia bacterium]